MHRCRPVYGESKFISLTTENPSAALLYLIAVSIDGTNVERWVQNVRQGGSLVISLRDISLQVWPERIDPLV